MSNPYMPCPACHDGKDCRRTATCRDLRYAWLRGRNSAAWDTLDAVRDTREAAYAEGLDAAKNAIFWGVVRDAGDEGERDFFVKAAKILDRAAKTYRLRHGVG